MNPTIPLDDLRNVTSPGTQSRRYLLLGFKDEKTPGDNHIAILEPIDEQGNSLPLMFKSIGMNFLPLTMQEWTTYTSGEMNPDESCEPVEFEITVKRVEPTSASRAKFGPVEVAAP